MYEVDFSEWPIRALSNLSDDIYDYLSFKNKEYSNSSDTYFDAHTALSSIQNFEQDVEEITDCISDILQYESIYAVMKGLKVYFSEGYKDDLSDKEIDDIVGIETVPLTETYIQLNKKCEKLKQNLKIRLLDEIVNMYNNLNISIESYRKYNLHLSFKEIIKVLKATDDMFNAV